jgi:hypothetical protein
VRIEPNITKEKTPHKRNLPFLAFLFDLVAAWAGVLGTLSRFRVAAAWLAVPCNQTVYSEFLTQILYHFTH